MSVVTKKGKLKKNKSKKKKTKKKVIDKEEEILKALGASFETKLTLDDDQYNIPYKIPFQHKGLQYITGGLPGGYFTEIHGESLTGKSYLMYELGLETIKMGGWYLQQDVERAYNVKFGKILGLEGHKRFIKSSKTELQDIISEAKRFILEIRSFDKDSPILIGTDSYSPIQIKASQKELDKQAVKPNEIKGYLAAKKNGLFSSLLGEFCQFIKKHKATWLLLNQTRKAMGLMFGDPTTTNAFELIQFQSSLRLRGKLGSKIKNKDNNKVVGRVTEWKTLKNRNGFPYVETSVRINYRKGLEVNSGFCELLEKDGRVEKKKVGKSYKYFYKGEAFTNKNVDEIVEKYPELLVSED